MGNGSSSFSFPLMTAKAPYSVGTGRSAVRVRFVSLDFADTRLATRCRVLFPFNFRRRFGRRRLGLPVQCEPINDGRHIRSCKYGNPYCSGNN